jgi:ATP-dependent helicase IRC3
MIFVSRLFRTAKWRKAPASSNQKEFIAKRWGLAKAEMDVDSHLKIDQLTKGEAANIITRLKHGAQVRILQSYASDAQTTFD